MRSRQISFRVTWKLYDQLNRLGRERGYKNLSRFMIGLTLKAIQDSKRRVWIPGIANADPKEQDYLIDKLLTFPTDMKEMRAMLEKMDGHPKREI
jgi:hypothetical protein